MQRFTLLLDAGNLQCFPQYENLLVPMGCTVCDSVASDGQAQ